MKIFKYLLYFIITVISIVIIYISIAYIFTIFPYQSKIDNDKKTKTIYLYYDDMHTDIIINIKDTNYNWQKLLPKLLKNRTKGYISFGWGDQETYLHTPFWSDLKLTTALKALFTNTPSLMHLNYYNNIDGSSEIKKIEVTNKQYQSIEDKILNSFGKKPIFIHKGYWENDLFYYSPYKYNLINTCNTWTGDILRESNITMSYWTPMSYCVVNFFPSTE
ncbi:MAG TPA: DUF2459 domain-containing protein [Campylobacterales bacterium]|nr:DUF2459 domain-containing protein [Campylobacterales bacterium]